MGKQNIRKSRVSYIFCVKQKSILFPKHGESQFQEYGKTKTFQIYEFLIYTIPVTWEKWVSIVRGKYGKTQTFQFMGFSNILGEAEIHAFPKTWGKWISIVREKYGIIQTFQSYGFLKYFG